jgi:hypothetical protein
MVEYKCLRCDKTFNHKTKFINHLKRKFICKSIISNISIKKVYNHYFKNDKKIVNSDVIEGDLDNPQKPSIVTQKPSNLLNYCEHCNKSYSRKDNLKRHYDTCKTKIQYDDNILNNKKILEKNKILENELKKVLQNRKKEKEKIKEEIIKQLSNSGQLVKSTQALIKKNVDNSQINNGQINNITISLNAYDETDKSYIKNSDVLTCIKKGNMGIPHMIKLLHCNINKPENHNVCLNNIKSNYIGVYDGDKWNYEMQYELIDMMAEDCINMIEDRIAEWKDDFYKKHKNIIDKFPHFLYKYYDSKSRYVQKRVHEETKLKLFNNKEIILKTKNKLIKK